MYQAILSTSDDKTSNVADKKRIAGLEEKMNDCNDKVNILVKAENKYRGLLVFDESTAVDSSGIL